MVITINADNPNIIDIGPNKITDWVKVECVTRYVSGKIVNDYCDYSPIEKIYYQADRKRWVIEKKNSLWAFYPNQDMYDCSLELIGRR